MNVLHKKCDNTYIFCKNTKNVDVGKIFLKDYATMRKMVYFCIPKKTRLWKHFYWRQGWVLG